MYCFLLYFYGARGNEGSCVSGFTVCSDFQPIVAKDTMVFYVCVDSAEEDFSQILERQKNRKVCL